MRKLLSMLLLLIAAATAWAVPAHKGTMKFRQPDGSQVTLALHGDEWRHFQTTADGYTVVKNREGYYVYATLANGQLQATETVAHDSEQRQPGEQTFLSGMQKFLAPAMTPQAAEMRQLVQQRQQQTLARRRAQARRADYDYEDFRGLVILVQFNDREFSRADYDQVITEMINTEGYDGYYDEQGQKQEFTGSVRDYYADNSGGRFQPEFDVYGPYTINFSQYDAEGSNNAARLTKAAVDAADEEIDFSIYDRDGDGEVELIYFVFAGMGANYNGNDSRLYWPHRGVMLNPDAQNWYDYYVQKDGVYLYDYASSVELYGFSEHPTSITIDGIGTICHEFSHVLGLPDFYDTDYEQSGGESNHPGIWSIMAGGSYENVARTPVGYSLYERWAVGFCDEPDVINCEGDYALEPLYSSQTGLRIDSPEKDVFFLLENRQRNAFRWDAYLPGSGMLVHRVDLSSNRPWQYNTVNVDPTNNRYEVLRAGGAHKAADGTYYATDADVFPGSARVRTLNNSTQPAALVTVKGSPAQWGLQDIAMTGGTVTFSVIDAYVLQSLSLPASVNVGLGMTRQLEVTTVPNIDMFQLTWESDNTDVATVSQQGLVTGMGEGTCVVTVSGDNGVSASCQVTVSEVDGLTIAQFIAQETGQELQLKFADAEVLYTYLTRIYVRDATGALTLNNLGIAANDNDRLNGVITAKLAYSNDMPQAQKSEHTNGADVVATAGEAVQPTEVKFDELSAQYYSDLVQLRAVQLKKINGQAYAVSGERQVRVNHTKFGSSAAKLPSDYDGKFFDLKGIFGTNRTAAAGIYDELGLVESPVEVEAPSGIYTLRMEPVANPRRRYTLQGQRVGQGFKGLVVTPGRSVVVR